MTKRALLLTMLATLWAVAPASAQLVAARNAPVASGHIHLYVPDTDVQKKFWVDTLGGTSIKVGTSPAEIIRVHNLLIMLAKRDSPGGTKGSVVDHIGFQVPNLRAVVDRLKAAGYPMVTRAELPTSIAVKDDIGVNNNTSIAMVMAPNEVKVELVETQGLAVPISLHHFHFAAPNVEEMRAFYVKTFGAKPQTRGSFPSAELPGVTLIFSPAAGSVAAIKGRVLDHIGFEVKDLEPYTKKLEENGIKLDRPYTKVAALGIAIAFIQDPWGTNIEFTDGFVAVP